MVATNSSFHIIMERVELGLAGVLEDPWGRNCQKKKIKSLKVLRTVNGLRHRTAREGKRSWSSMPGIPWRKISGWTYGYPKETVLNCRESGQGGVAVSDIRFQHNSQVHQRHAGWSKQITVKQNNSSVRFQQRLILAVMSHDILGRMQEQ